MITFAGSEKGYANLWAKATIQAKKQAEIDKVCDRIIRNRARYEAVEQKTGVPWAWIGVIHNREASGNFARVLHNGERIIGTGQKTRLVPEGRGPFSSWEQAAVDALRLKGLHKITDWSIARMLYEAERFNGFGYFGKRVNSPYIWAATSLQQPGKYIRDHVWSPTEWDQQLGVAAMMKGLLARDQGIFVRPSPVPSMPVIITTSGAAAGSLLLNNTTALSAIASAIVIALYEFHKTEKGKAMLTTVLKNWKTTLTGIAAVAGAIATIATSLSSGSLDPSVLMAAVSSLSAGIGLIFGKDANVTGGTKRQ